VKGLVLVYILTAIGMVSALRAPRLGLFVYIGFSVLRPTFLWGYAGNTQGLSYMVAVAMFIGWALAGFGRWRFSGGRSLVLALLAFAGWSALSALQAENTNLAFESLVELGKIVLPFLVGVTILQSERDIRALLWIMVAAQGYVCLEMNLSYLQGYNRAQLEGFGGMDNNSFGISLVTSLGAVVALFLSSTRWLERAILTVPGLLILHTILLTFSRGALLGLIAVGVMALILMPKRPSYVVAALAVLLLTIRLTGPELAARYQSAFVEGEERDTSAASRLELWGDCLAVMAAEPLLGVGPQNWIVVAERFGWPRGKQAHSVWMQTGAETGVPGVAFLLSFYLLGVFKLWRVVRRRPPGRLPPRHAYALGLALAVTGYVTSAQFVSLMGLEMPFYLIMLGVVLLKQNPLDVAQETGEKAPFNQTKGDQPSRPIAGGPFALPLRPRTGHLLKTGNVSPLPS
jgi:O-antigen ligase